MPIYEYQCDSCGAQRELFVRSTDAPLPKCPECRKKMRRVISQTAFILKGSGWYVTDYPSAARTKGLEGEKAPAAAPAEGGEKKDPAKTEAAKPATVAAPAAPAAGKGRKKKP